MAKLKVRTKRTNCMGHSYDFESSMKVRKYFLRHELHCPAHLRHGHAAEVDHADDMSDADMFVFSENRAGVFRGAKHASFCFLIVSRSSVRAPGRRFFVR